MDPMRGHFVAALLFSALFSFVSFPVDGVTSWYGLNETSDCDRRLLANEYALINLGKQLEGLRQKLRKDLTQTEGIYERIEETLEYMKETGCEDNEYQCGGNARQCIYELFVCDGIKDCANGQDEDPVYCDVSRLTPGMSFSGHFTQGKCGRAARKSYFCRIRVNSVVGNPVFGSRMALQLQSVCEFWYFSGKGWIKNNLTNFYPGSYEVSHRRWLSGAEGYSSECQFTDETLSRMRCRTRQGQLSQCRNKDIIVFRDK